MKSPSFDFGSLPFVTRACKFFKIASRSDDGSQIRRGSSKGISFSNEVYQQTCEPVASGDEGTTWRNPLSFWQKNASLESTPVAEVTSPRSSIRMYKNPWGRKSDGESSCCLEEDAGQDAAGSEDEGIFTIELVKPPNGYLGLVLVGGADTPLQKHYVKDILPNSTASKADSVRTGDELIEVNGHTLRGRTHSSALAVIRSLPPSIRLTIERTMDGNRSILASFQCSKKQDGGDPNITSPKARTRKRSILQDANDSSIINTTESLVIDISRITSPLVKPAKLVRRESKCSSFIGQIDEDDDVNCAESEVNTNDNDDCLSMISNTSAWCARQMSMCKQEDASSQHSSDSGDMTSTFSLCTLSESLPGTLTEENSLEEQEYAPYQTVVLRHGTVRERNILTEPINEVEVESDEEERRMPEEPAMFLRRGSLRVRGSLSFRRASCIESREERATWPATARRQRSSLNWDTFVPPPDKPVRRSSSTCIRPSSMYVKNDPSNRRPKAKNSEQPKSQMQRSNSTGKYIDKLTLTTKVYRSPATGDWGFSIAGGVCSPYGDLPIHILNIHNSAGGSVLKKGDEIVSFGGENFGNVTFLDADKKMKNYESSVATVILKRKYLHRKKSQICNTFADAWNEQAKESSRRLKNRPESFYY